MGVTSAAIVMRELTLRICPHASLLVTMAVPEGGATITRVVSPSVHQTKSA